MGTERTPPLSVEGSREVEEEMRRPPADTPERRATFARMREVEELLRRNNSPSRNDKAAGACHADDGKAVDQSEKSMCSAEPTPPLSVEGSCDIEEEMRRSPADTPERRAAFARMRRVQELLSRNKPPSVHGNE